MPLTAVPLRVNGTLTATAVDDDKLTVMLNVAADSLTVSLALLNCTVGVTAGSVMVRVLTVTAQGIPPFTYQWFHTNTGSAIGPGINGSLTAVLTITNVATSNLGTYTCLVSNAYGIASNFTAILQ